MKESLQAIVQAIKKASMTVNLNKLENKTNQIRADSHPFKRFLQSYRTCVCEWESLFHLIRLNEKGLMTFISQKPAHQQTLFLLPLSISSKFFKSRFPNLLPLSQRHGSTLGLHRRHSGVRGLLLRAAKDPSSSELEQDSLLCPGSGSPRDLWPLKDLRSLAADPPTIPSTSNSPLHPQISQFSSHSFPQTPEADLRSRLWIGLEGFALHQLNSGPY